MNKQKLANIADEYEEHLRLSRVVQCESSMNRKTRASELAMEYNSIKPWYLPRLPLV